MADAANHPVPSIAATGVAGGSYLTPAEGLWKCVQHLRCNIAVLEERCAQKETVQKSTQHKLDRACRRHQSDEATMRRLESRLEAQKQNLTSDAQLIMILTSFLRMATATTSVLSFAGGPAALPGCSQTGHAGPPSPARSADAQCDKNFHLKMHYSKKAVIMDDKRGVVFEATESPADAKKRKRREEYARTKAKRLTRDRATQSDPQRPLERHGSGAMASASGSSAASSGSGHGVPSSAAEAVPHMSDDTEDGGRPHKKSKQVARKQDEA